MTHRYLAGAAGQDNLQRSPAGLPSRPIRSGVHGSELAALLGRVAAGEKLAFDQLYGASHGTVLGITQAILRDRSQAEEVTQEVFLQIWRQAGNFDPARGSAASWIWRVAHARAVDRVRGSQAIRANDNRYAQHEYERDVDSVVEVVLRNADITALTAALSELSVLQQQAILLTYFGDHTRVQASDLLGIPVATLKSRILSGLTALRRAHPGDEITMN